MHFALRQVAIPHPLIEVGVSLPRLDEKILEAAKELSLEDLKKIKKEMENDN